VSPYMEEKGTFNNTLFLGCRRLLLRIYLVLFNAVYFLGIYFLS
jgi:hypothetical protein